MNVFVKFITIQSRLEKKKPSDRLGCNYTHKGICHFQHNMRILIYGITAGELPASIKIAGETILYLMTRNPSLSMCYFSYLCNTERENSPINYLLPICRLKQGSRLPAYPVGE